ncbi:MAG: transporter ATP-binding protein [Fibrobacteria bacterium]|jgi:ATP-binding cassette ChvD family protein|nr:transporter ATP-binding protein [Fibrobacteria bacterium]
MAEKFIYYMHRLSKTYPPAKKVLDNVSLSFYYGAKIGIIGYNGAGKSTLMKIMAGMDKDFDGEAWIESGRTVGYLSQEPQLDPNLTVKENVELAVAGTKKLLKDFEEISLKFGEEMSDEAMEKLLEKQSKLQDQIDAADAWDLDRHLEIAMDALRLPPGDSAVTHLSGGEKRRVALCKLLLEKPDLLLLDEPTNHLDAESVAWLQTHLAAYKGSVILVTHDRYFLDSVVGWILELDRGRGHPYEGNYSAWLEQKGARLKQEEKEESNRQRVLKAELEWVRMSPKARQSKGKARLASYEELLQAATPEKLKGAQISIPPGPRLGDTVIEVKGVRKAFGDKLLFENLEFSLPKAGIVGVIGPNGAGKTTLFKLITGQEKPDAGTVRLGESVVLSYVDQSRDTLNGEKSVFEEIAGGDVDLIRLGGPNGVEVAARAYVAKFNFGGSDQQKKVKDLSGGERNRVHLAKLLQTGGNVLLLDEPTNDLDVETLQGLENAIAEFSGCAVIISHDRWFLDRLATHILAFEGDSQVVYFEGNYAAYEENRKKRLGIDADTPHRIHYKPLTRG